MYADSARSQLRGHDTGLAVYAWSHGVDTLRLSGARVFADGADAAHFPALRDGDAEAARSPAPLVASPGVRRAPSQAKDPLACATVAPAIAPPFLGPFTGASSVTSS